MPNFKRIGGGPWKNGQKSDDLTWNDPGASQLILGRSYEGSLSGSFNNFIIIPVVSFQFCVSLYLNYDNNNLLLADLTINNCNVCVNDQKARPSAVVFSTVEPRFTVTSVAWLLLQQGHHCSVPNNVL